MHSNKNLIMVTVIRVALLILFFSMFSLYMEILKPVAAYMDTLRYLLYVGDSFDGKSSIFSTWNQGEHRGLLGQIGTYLNAKLFDFNVLGSAYFCGFILLIAGWLVSHQQITSLVNRSMSNRFDIFFLLFVTFSGLFSLANWELYSLDVGVYLFLRILIFIIYWQFLGYALARDGTGVARNLLLISMPLIVLFFAYGYAYIFVATTLVICLFVAPINLAAARFRFLLILVGICSVALYVVGGYLLPSQTHVYVWQEIHIFNVILGGFNAVSSVFLGHDSWTDRHFQELYRVLISGLYILFLIYLLCISFKDRNSLILAYALIIYSSFQIIAVAYARGNAEPIAAAASRYYADYSLLVVGTVWLFVYSNIKNKLLKFYGYFIFCMFILGQTATSVDEMNRAPYRHAGFEAIKQLVLLGEDESNQKIADMTQQPADTALKSFEVQRKYALGPFRDIGCAPVYLYGRFDDGWIEKKSRFIVRKCGETLSIAISYPTGFPANILRIYSRSGLLLDTISIEPGKSIAKNISTKDFGLIVDIRLELDHASRPVDLSVTSGDLRSLGALVTVTSIE